MTIRTRSRGSRKKPTPPKVPAKKRTRSSRATSKGRKRNNPERKPIHQERRDRFIRWCIRRHRRRKELAQWANPDDKSYSSALDPKHRTGSTNDDEISKLRAIAREHGDLYCSCGQTIVSTHSIYRKCMQLGKYTVLLMYFITAALLLIGVLHEMNFHFRKSMPARVTDWMNPVMDWISALSSDLSQFNENAKIFLDSPFYQLFIQSFFISLFSFIVRTLWIEIRALYVRCGGVYDMDDPEKLKQLLKYDRLNITLNILEEGHSPWGNTYPRRQDSGAGHQIHMRTIHESPLTDCFGGEQDPYVLKTMIKENQPWDPQKNVVAPFLSADVLKGLKDRTINSFSKQMTDQIINRLSMLFGGAYVAQDQGLEYNSCQYVFGLTYEEPDPDKNTRQKVRCLVMKEESLKRLVELWEIDPLRFDFSKNPYSEVRTRHLINMYRIYRDRQRLNKVLERINDSLGGGGGNSATLVDKEKNIPVMGALVYHLFIAAQGIKGGFQVVTAHP